MSQHVLFTVSVHSPSGAHEHHVLLDHEFFANVWHSDVGEWTLDTVDGLSFHHRGSGAETRALQQAKSLAADEGKRRLITSGRLATA